MLLHVYHSNTVNGEEWDVTQFQTPLQNFGVEIVLNSIVYEDCDFK